MKKQISIVLASAALMFAAVDPTVTLTALADALSGLLLYHWATWLPVPQSKNCTL